VDLSQEQLPTPTAEERTGTEDPRVTRSRQVIMAAATEHFLAAGYVGANIDQIAAQARVSKRTVYNIYGSKEQLFHELMAQTAQIAEDFAGEVVVGLTEATDVEAELRQTAVRLAQTVIDVRIVRLRRLLIGEAERYPATAAEYYRRAPGLTLDRLAEALRQFDQRGALRVENPMMAAEHFAFLSMGATLDRALFTENDQLPTPEQVESRARAGVEVFLRAYRAP
jgi:TetR/AcrR family transcriptional repressor of mexJK operon